MFTLRMILYKLQEYRLQTHYLFIAVKKRTLAKHGFPTKLIKLIRIRLDGSISSVYLNNKLDLNEVLDCM